tara:strand:- start:124 stop:345 length:222 start_codon:yes stop_codon:yes gene_type:complete
MIINANKIKYMMECLFIAFKMGGVEQARKAIKTLRKQNYDQGLDKTFKYLIQSDKFGSLEKSLIELQQVWHGA